MKQICSLLLFFLLTVSCTDPSHDSSVEARVDSEHAGMILVEATGESTTLGTNDAAAASNAKPAMKVKFAYDFSISKSEVTRSEYAALMEKNISIASDSADLPQTNVTYYDAVLYANARSSQEGYDTAYSYSSATFDSEGNCTNLDGLVFDPSQEAYRLPTEAEWMLAAGEGWNTSSAWTNVNSEYHSHPVCTIGENDLGLCDLAGNAMEWVNDWLGNLLDTTVTNSVGAPDGGTLGQRVVKGGSYKNDPSNITLYSRGDIYAVTSATKAEYVGFRLAFGSISTPLWVSGAGVSLSRVSVVATSGQVKSVTGTYHTKLVFVNYETGNLAYIDFSNSTLAVTEIVDTLPVFHPDISPDGKRVAFCTKVEGVSGTSEVYVRDLNATGTNLVKLNVASAAIPRWRVVGADTVIVYVTDAGNNKEDAEWKQKSTWQVPFAGGKFGTPVKLFDGSYHDGISEDGSLAVTGARLLRANVSGKDTVWYNGEQACNASLSKDSTKRTLFLDFGSETGKTFVGKEYATHERLLFADSTGKLIQSIAAPANYTFDHSEWSNVKNVAVATVTNTNGAHSAIYLISTVDSSLLKVAEGDELWHPCLWVAKSNIITNFDLDLDSAGVYMSKTYADYIESMRYKMELFWQYHDSLTVLIWGSSRPYRGINPMMLTNEFAINMSVACNDITMAARFFENYFLPHCSKMRTYVISLDFDLWHESLWDTYYESVPGYHYDKNHDYWKSGIPAELPRLSVDAWGGNEINRETNKIYNGFVGISNGSGWENIDMSQDSIATTIKSLYEEKLLILEKLLKLAQQNNIRVIGIIFPQSPLYAQTGMYGRHGLTRSYAVEIIARAMEMQTEYNNFTVMDENKMGAHDYTTAMAYDSDHLNSLGAVQLTTRLDSLLKTLE
ncbi:MAG: hypothetical protein AUK31_00760 [Fibrobacteres bacterium CG2_30_45_31]|nr:MAG: hypothetical protein AUK31_00760 [Fibrobacteres bacterium CG2_30_45_31]